MVYHMSEEKTQWKVWADDSQEAESQIVTPLARGQIDPINHECRFFKPLHVIYTQAIAGLAGVAIWLVWDYESQAWVSAVCAMVVTMVPSLLMILGLKSLWLKSAEPKFGLVRFVVWEFFKLLLSAAMMIVMVLSVKPWNWLAFLSVMVWCLQMYWFGPLLLTWVFSFNNLKQNS